VETKLCNQEVGVVNKSLLCARGGSDDRLKSTFARNGGLGDRRKDMNYRTRSMPVVRDGRER
jgi:hypothetical protein